MLRKLLLLLAVLVLAAIALVWIGVVNWPGGSSVEVRPVDVKLETRNVALPLPVVETPGQVPANGAQPAPPAAASPPPPAQPQPAPQQ